MTQPRLGSVNLVVEDVEAAASFLDALGVALEPTAPDWAEWATHHRNVEAVVPEFEVDLDGPSFARWWGGVPEDFAPGVVVNVRVDTAGAVDDLHERAVELGARELKAPWDAFWGSRYSVVRAPGPVCVGIMSTPDPTRRTPGPSISDFA